MVLELGTDDLAQLRGNPAWFMISALIRAGSLLDVFKLHTPIIFSNWRASAYMLLGVEATSRYLGLIFLAIWIAPAPWVAAGTFFQSTTAIAVVMVIYAGCLFIVLLLVRIMFLGLVGRINASDTLNDPAALLVILHRLGVTMPVSVDTAGLHKERFRRLEAMGVITGYAPPQGGRRLVFTSAEDIVSGQVTRQADKKGVSEVVWCRKGFASHAKLPSSVQQSWVHTSCHENRPVEYDTMCSVILLFAIDHREVLGIHLTAKSDKKTLRGSRLPDLEK